MERHLEAQACQPVPLDTNAFNPDPTFPHRLEPTHVRQATDDFLEFLGYVNQTLFDQDIQRLESIAMPANFSSLVGEFMHARIPKYCDALVQNTYHNGHPDLIPAGRYDENAVQHGDHGIEVKASRYGSGWQGHNVEECWLMVFHYESNRPADPEKDIKPFPFRFKGVYLGELEEDDWSFSGRSGENRRTITASVLASGRDKMKANAIYDTRRSQD